MKKLNQILKEMKTQAKHFTAYGNLGLVQVKVEPKTTFSFSPAAPYIKSGELVISESTDLGIVGKLTALNTTDFYLLLTDADILVGAKQNRVLNRSVLLAPTSKTVLDVSCVERGRWQYSEKTFHAPVNTANPDLRRVKTKSMARKKSASHEFAEDTQGTVWSHVRMNMDSINFENATESYSALLSYQMDSKKNKFPKCEPDKESNCLAVVMGSKVINADIFGTAGAYRHYFPMLRDSAFRMASAGEKQKSPDMHEAYYRVLESLDSFEAIEKHPEADYSGAGSFRVAESNELVGFELRAGNEIIHSVLFSK
jgi:hypothetical protein